MTEYVIAPSILSANFAKLGQEVHQVLAAGADWIHFDVMDNHYVPNLTIGPMVCSALREDGVTAPIDVHLMIEPVDSLIAPFAEAGASLISFHPEASRHVHRTVKLIQSFSIQAGVVLNPASPIDLLYPILDELDFVLMMSVNPGFGGQKFITNSLKRCEQVAELIRQSGKPIRLEIDGGVTVENIASIRNCGVDTFVAGSAIFKTDDYQQTLSAFRQQLASPV